MAAIPPPNIIQAGGGKVKVNADGSIAVNAASGKTTTLQPAASGDEGLIIKAASGQSAALLDFHDNSGNTTSCYFDSAGRLKLFNAFGAAGTFSGIFGESQIAVTGITNVDIMTMNRGGGSGTFITMTGTTPVNGSALSSLLSDDNTGGLANTATKGWDVTLGSARDSPGVYGLSLVVKNLGTVKGTNSNEAVGIDLTTTQNIGSGAAAYGIRSIAGTANVVPIMAKAAGSQTADLTQWQDSSGNVLANVSSAGQVGRYKNVATAGWGVPAIYASHRSTAQTGAVASVATYTVGAADGSFKVSANVLVTTSTTHSFTVTCAYTDEGNTARTATLSFNLLAGGTPVTSIANANGAVPYMGIPLEIRAKAATAITIATTGTFTTVTYNVEGLIQQVA